MTFAEYNKELHKLGYKLTGGNYNQNLYIVKTVDDNKAVLNVDIGKKTMCVRDSFMDSDVEKLTKEFLRTPDNELYHKRTIEDLQIMLQEEIDPHYNIVETLNNEYFILYKEELVFIYDKDHKIGRCVNSFEFLTYQNIKDLKTIYEIIEG